MNEPTTYPTAREIAVAIVTAARIHEDDPVLTIEGATSHRGRWLAMAGLHDAFPDVPIFSIAAWCGLGSCELRGGQAYKGAKGVLWHLSQRRTNRHIYPWFLDSDLETVKSSIAAAIAETEAELRNRLSDFGPAPCESNPPEAPKSEPTPADFPRLRLFNITSDELRGLPAELIEQLSPEARALAAATPADAPALVPLAPFFSPLFGGLKSDVLDTEEPDFSHLRDARDRSKAIPAPITPKPVSAAARSLADFQRSRIVKTARGRIIDYRQEGFVDMGDPKPGRSALDERGTP